MGYFAATCSLSDLPIPGGTSIRVLLLTENPYGDGWDLRAPPIRAVYDDYGGIQCVEPSDGVITDLWLKGLEVDMVCRHKGLLAASHEKLSFDELVLALKEGRVMVRQDVKDFWRPPVEAQLHRPSGPREKDSNEDRTLRVRWAFVRSDVWDGLVAEKRPCWWSPGTMDEAVSRVVEFYEGLVEDNPVSRILRKNQGENSIPHFTALAYPGKDGLVKSTPGVIGLTEHLALLKLAAMGAEDVARILDATAEMVHVHFFLHDARRVWEPVEFCRGAQDAEWRDQLRFMKVVMAVALAEKRRDEARMRECE